MIGILLLIALLCLAVMDNIGSYDTFGIYFGKLYMKTGKRVYSHLEFWFRSDGWENKYQLSEWLQKIHVPKRLAAYIASDVLVIITDGWHCFKAAFMVCILIPFYKVMVLYLYTEYGVCICRYHAANITLLFFITGIIFNFFFYRLRKINLHK